MDEKLASGLAGGAIVAFLTVLFTKGWPVLKEWLNWSDEKEKVRLAQAKEGPLMVNVRLELELKETKEELGLVKAELRALQKDHATCEKEQARTRVTIEYQNADIAELKQQNTELKQSLAALEEQARCWKKIQASTVAQEQPKE